MFEFGSKGYGGARTEAIAKRAKCNIRMLYHYFSGKEGLYLACLEQVYWHIRDEERKLNFEHMPPVDAIKKLVHFTFDHMRNNPEFVYMAVAENTMRAKFLKKLPNLAKAAQDLLSQIRSILAKGEAECNFRSEIDPLQLYSSILSLSYLHLSNQHTLSATYEQDMTESDWLEKRRDHVSDMILAYCIKNEKLGRCQSD